MTDCRPHRTSSRHASATTCSSEPRRRARCAPDSSPPPSKQRSSPAMPTSSRRSSSRPCARRRRRRRTPTSANGSTACGRPASRGSSSPASLLCRTPCRTPSSPRRSSTRARRFRFAPLRRASGTLSGVRRPRGARASSRWTPPPSSTTGATSSSAPARRSARSSPASPTRFGAARRRRASRSPSSRWFSPTRAHCLPRRTTDCVERWLDRLLGSDRAPEPSSYHAPYVYRLSRARRHVLRRSGRRTSAWRRCAISASTSRRTRNIQVDLEDRPQKAPRPAVIPADPPAVVHLITRAQGGLQDYQGLLHEAGHALHFAGCDPALPYAFRKLSRDNALTEIYSYAVQSVIREPDVACAALRPLARPDASENAEAARFLDAFMFRRNVAKLHFELDFWARFRG